MTRRMMAVAAAVGLLVLSLGCSLVERTIGGGIVRGSGNVVEETRQIGGVDGVQLATIGTLYIEVGDDEALRIEAEDNLLRYIRTEVRGDTLVIDMEPGTSLRNTEPINYYLTVEELSSIALSSSGDAEAPDLEADRFRIRVSSSGDLSMGELTCETCTIELSSSGDVTLDAVYAPELNVQISSSGQLTIDDGDVERQEVRLSSSGDYNARGLDSETAYVRVSSSGTATVRVDELLDADLSSSGNVVYYGDPEVDADTSSSGDVIEGGD